MLGSLFGRRRERPPAAADGDDLDSPPSKKRKIADHGENELKEGQLSRAKTVVLRDNPCLLQNIASFLDRRSEWQLAACDKHFSEFFTTRDLRRFIVLRDLEKDVFLSRVLASVALSLPKEEQSWRQPASSIWTAMKSWLWGRRSQSRPHPWRYFLLHACKVPLLTEKWVNFGPSCASSSTRGMNL